LSSIRAPIRRASSRRWKRRGAVRHLAPPFDLIAEKRGYTMPRLALPGLGIPWQQNGELVPAVSKSNRDNVVRLLGNCGGGKFYFDQKENHRDHDRNTLGRPRDETEYALQPVQALDRPHPTTAGRYDQNDARRIKKNTPAATANAASFVDTSLVDQLVKEGYYK
jgi:hypothetical protein